MSTITWLHLSDLHFCELQAYDQNVVLQTLLRDVAECVKGFSLQPDFIVVSGDIAFASRPAEYAMAQRFLNELLKINLLKKNRLFLVPGNHDVDRSVIHSQVADTIAIPSDREAVNQLLSNDSKRAHVMLRFHNYRDFVNQYLGKHLSFDDAAYFYSKTIKVAEKRVAILGLNSAWSCASDKDRNSIFLGEQQVRAALAGVRNADLRVAVMHHPFEWLNDDDRNDVEPLLSEECNFVLRGHTHQPSFIQVNTPDTQTMIIPGGACYETRKYPNSYNFVRLDLGTGTGKVYLRIYSDKQGGFWTKDVLNHKNMRDGVYEFQLFESRGEKTSRGPRLPSVENIDDVFKKYPFAGQVRAGRGDTKRSIIELLEEGQRYSFEVMGDSMKREGIHEGYLIIVQVFKVSEFEGPREGDKIVADYSPDNAIAESDLEGPTLKIYHEVVDGKAFRLGWKRHNRPSNKNDVLIDPGNPQMIKTKYVKPIGKVIGCGRPGPRRARTWKYVEWLERPPIILGGEG